MKDTNKFVNNKDFGIIAQSDNRKNQIEKIKKDYLAGKDSIKQIPGRNKPVKDPKKKML